MLALALEADGTWLMKVDGHQPAIESRQHARNAPPAVISSFCLGNLSSFP
jgi:hypothetical protein